MNNIYVIVRDTFPTDEILDKTKLKEKKVLNPYDEYALYQAIKLKNKCGGKVICIFISEDETYYGLKTALGLGADEGIYIKCNSKYEREIAKIIKKILSKKEFDSIFIGIRDVNNDREELPASLAIALNIPLYSHLLKVSYNEDLFIKKETDRCIETYKIIEKGIFAFSQNVYEPQYPTISSIMEIKNKEVIAYDESFVFHDNSEVFFYDVERKKEIYTKINSVEGINKIMDYLKNWKLVE